MSNLQQLLEEKYPDSEISHIQRKAFEEGRRYILYVLRDVIDLADYGYRARCASNHPRNEIAVSLRSLNSAKAVLEEANK